MSVTCLLCSRESSHFISIHLSACPPICCSSGTTIQKKATRFQPILLLVLLICFINLSQESSLHQLLSLLIRLLLSPLIPLPLHVCQLSPHFISISVIVLAFIDYVACTMPPLQMSSSPLCFSILSMTLFYLLFCSTSKN